MDKKLTPHFIDLTMDACLKAFWRREALRRFLLQHSIKETALATWHEDESKRQFLQRLFGRLVARKDLVGHRAILSMARSLTEMDSFPDLDGWADSSEKKKLANEAVALLRKQVATLDQQLVDKKDAADRRRRAAERREKAILEQQTLEGLSDRLNQLSQKLGDQQAGYDFERWFYDLAIFFEIPARPPYKTGGRQIDGSITVSGTEYLIETKFTKDRTAPKEITDFMSKIHKKADNTMGICISITGFTPQAIADASCEQTPLLLIDHSHLYGYVLSGTMTLPEVINRIRQHASQTGESFLEADRFSG